MVRPDPAVLLSCRSSAKRLASPVSVEGRQARLQSFKKSDVRFPHLRSTGNLTAMRLATAGFRFDPEGEGSDRTVLELTGASYGDWSPADDPVVVALEAIQSLLRDVPAETQKDGASASNPVTPREARLREAAIFLVRLLEDEQRRQRRPDGSSAGAAAASVVEGGAPKPDAAQLEQMLLATPTPTWELKVQYLRKLQRITREPSWKELAADSDDEVVAAVSAMLPPPPQQRTKPPAPRAHATPLKRRRALNDIAALSSEEAGDAVSVPPIRSKANSTASKRRSHVQLLADRLLFNGTELPRPDPMASFDMVVGGRPLEGAALSPDGHTITRYLCNTTWLIWT